MNTFNYGLYPYEAVSEVAGYGEMGLVGSRNPVKYAGVSFERCKKNNGKFNNKRDNIGFNKLGTCNSVSQSNERGKHNTCLSHLC